MSKSVVILGAGGHAAVVADIVLQNGFDLLGFLDDSPALCGSEISGAKVLGPVESCGDYKDCVFVIGIGNNVVRKSIAESYKLPYRAFIHPSAVVARGTSIGDGTVVMAGCVINPRSVIGGHCIINTRAGVDHDNIIEDFVHISPGVSLGGAVTVRECTHVGIGASVRNNIEICGHAIVGAGAAVVRDITASGTYAGVPARRIK